MQTPILTATFCGDIGWSRADPFWEGPVSPEEFWYGDCLQGLQQESHNDQCHSCRLSRPHQGVAEVSKPAGHFPFALCYKMLSVTPWCVPIVPATQVLETEEIGSPPEPRNWESSPSNTWESCLWCVCVCIGWYSIHPLFSLIVFIHLNSWLLLWFNLYLYEFMWL